MRNLWIIATLMSAALGSVGFVGMISGAAGFGPQDLLFEIRFLIGLFSLGFGLAVAFMIGFGEIKGGRWIGWAEYPEKQVNHPGWSGNMPKE